MKLAYVIADRYIPVFGTKGASIHVQEMVNAFASLGHEVTLVTTRTGDPTGELNADIVEVRRDKSQNSDRGSWDGEDKRHAKERRALQRSDLVRDRLIELHADNPFDFIYERYSLFSTAGIRAARDIGIPYIVEVNSPLLLEQQKYRKLACLEEAQSVETEVFSNADALLAVSEPVRSYAVSRSARLAHTHVIPNAVDIKRFHPRVKPSLIDGVADKFIVGFVGSLKPWHGIDVLMASFRLLAGESSDYHLLIVGDGPLRGWVEGYTSGAGHDGHVTITGWLSNEKLPGLIKAMDVAVAPYPETEDFYFSPLKLYEYMAMGTPVVASRVGQIADVIVDGATGLLNKPGDPTHLADCIQRLRRDRVLHRSIGAAAARSVERTWEHNAWRVIEIATPLIRTA